MYGMTIQKGGKVMKQIASLIFALLTISGPADAGPWAAGQSVKEDAREAIHAQRVAQTNKPGTQDKRDAGKSESRSGYHGDTSSKHGNANFPERPQSQHGHGNTPGGPQH